MRSAWRQLAPGGVQALEDELRVVLVAVERDVHDHELRQPLAERRQLVLDLGHALLEELEVRLDADRVLLRLRLPVEQRDQRRLVGLRQEQLVAPLAVLERVEQVVVAQLPGREAVQRLGSRRDCGPAPR